MATLSRDVSAAFDAADARAQKVLQTTEDLARRQRLAAIEQRNNDFRAAEAIRMQINPKLELIKLQEHLNRLVAQGALSQGEAQQFLAHQHRLEAGSRAASRYGLILQQAGFQAQDFAVQVASGTNALVAFSQQASQMLGFFGPQGAIAGALISTAILAIRMGQLAQEARKASDAIATLADARTALQQAVARGREVRGEGPNIATLEQELGAARARLGLAQQQERYARGTFEYVARETDNSISLLAWGVKRLALIKAGQDFESRTLEVEKERLAVLQAQNAVMEAQAVARKARESAMNDLQQRVMDEERGGREAAMNEVGQRVADENKRLQQRAEAIKDQLDPLREEVRLRQELQSMIDRNLLSEEQRTAFLQRQADATFQQVASRLQGFMQAPQSALSAIGLGATSAADPVRIMREMLDTLRSILSLQENYAP
jgi:hypothetical protein